MNKKLVASYLIINVVPTMAPTYRLTYFDATGIGECIRFLFSYGGIPFEDNRIEFNLNKWRTRKDKPMYGFLPLLEVDGKMVNQSIAIARFLAKKVGLVGKDDWENLEIDAVVDTQNDLRLKLTELLLTLDKDKKTEIKEEYRKNLLPYYLSRFETQVGENGGYFVGGKLTLADFHFVGVLNAWKYAMGGDILEGYPNLMSLREKVHNLPAIKEWVKKRPRTLF